MSEMTREHLEAVRECAKNDREWAGWVTPTRVRVAISNRAARLSEVAAMIEAKLESRDDTTRT